MEQKPTYSLKIDQAAVNQKAAEFEQDIIAVAASMPMALAKVGTLRDAIKAGDRDTARAVGDWFRGWFQKVYNAANSLTLVEGYGEIYQRVMDAEKENCAD